MRLLLDIYDWHCNFTHNAIDTLFCIFTSRCYGVCYQHSYRSSRAFRSFSFRRLVCFTKHRCPMRCENISVARRQPGVTLSSPIDQFTVQVSFVSKYFLSILILTALFRSHLHSMLLMRPTLWFWTIDTRSMGRTVPPSSKLVMLKLPSPLIAHKGRQWALFTFRTLF